MDLKLEIETNTKEFKELQMAQAQLTQQLNDINQRMIKCVGKDELLQKLSQENGHSKEAIPVKAEK
uniref:Uncharacterized protein n=1 Tax=viral metagenome TaxID=1070528 RepID=A0A6M3IR29_9ZZZZ